MNKLLSILTIAIINVGCVGQKPINFESKTPRFIPEEYFNGEVKGSGMFFSRSDKVKLNLDVTLNGTWDGKVLLLKEHMIYDNGEIVDREYRITKIDEHHYEAEMSDFAGTAKLESYGNVLRWKYVLKQKIGDKVWELNFDDWMYLQNDGLLLDRAFASKFGLDVGELFLAVKKVQ